MEKGPSSIPVGTHAIITSCVRWDIDMKPWSLQQWQAKLWWAVSPFTNMV